MTEKWNIITAGGTGADDAITELEDELESTGASAARLETDEGAPFLRVPGYDFSNGESIRFWLIDRLKELDSPPDWAVVTHANTTEDGGRAWVFRNHSDHMDLIDVVLGHGTLFGEDVEAYLSRDHGVSVPVWMDTVPGDTHISVGSIGKAMADIPQQTLEQVLARYPLFNIPGTLADPHDVTQPDTPHSDTPSTEERSVTLSTGELAFLQKSLREYTDYDAESFIDETFTENTFTGTWAEFKEAFWDPLDAILGGLYGAELTRDESDDVRGQANTLKWQFALDWHQ